MLLCRCKYWLFIPAAFFLFTCKKPFQPVIPAASISILVVDGIVNTAPNGITVITLSRARSLTDSTYDISAEGGAAVSIESSGGGVYQLPQSGTVYTSAPLNLDISQTYRIHVTTSGGQQYLSAFVQVKQSPPIDSLTWQQDNGVNIYAWSHDDANKTKYYRWDFTETWQHNARYQTSYGVNNGRIFSLDSTNQMFECWDNANSTGIITATTTALSLDVISRQPITNLPQDDPKIGVRYSILVRQYALTPEAYQYWQIIQKNTENIGTLFDVQPSQLFGNVSSQTNKNEAVIGFISAGSVQEKRIFINNNQLTNWAIPVEGFNCDIKNIPQNPQDFQIYDYADTSYGPYFFTTMPSGLNITKHDCLDCRLQGGTNIKPSFWR